MKMPKDSSADAVHVLNSPEDVRPMTSGVLRVIAEASLREVGWYSCKIAGQKTLFRIAS